MTYRDNALMMRESTQKKVSLWERFLWWWGYRPADLRNRMNNDLQSHQKNKKLASKAWRRISRRINIRTESYAITDSDLNTRKYSFWTGGYYCRSIPIGYLKPLVEKDGYVLWEDINDITYFGTEEAFLECKGAERL